MMDWISVKDRVPTKDECSRYAGWFLVCRSFLGRPELSRYDGHEEEFAYEHGWKYCIDREITHWMPLPELPAERLSTDVHLAAPTDAPD
jgi:hypothetical protein